MSFKRGVGGVGANVAPPAAPQIIGRPLASVRQSVIATPTQAQPPQRVLTKPPVQHEPAVRGLLVDGNGKPLRGLSQATMQAHKAYSETESELCTNCGRMRTPQHMKTVIGNAANSSNPLRICDVPGDPTSCVALAYKDPAKVESRQIEPWRPSMPAIRFDRNTAAPYDPAKRGVGINELLRRDTYHDEREVDVQYRADTIADEGRWSGGGRTGHVVSSETVAQSRERAARTRR